MKSIVTIFASVTILSCQSTGNPAPSDAGLSLPMYDNRYGCDPTCVVTIFRQSVNSPDDCYCLGCPTAMPRWAAAENEQNYNKFCGKGWPGHDCISPPCIGMVCECADAATSDASIP